MALFDIGLIEAFLIQVVIYVLIYIADSYVGFLICVVAGSIGMAAFVLSLLFEWIERSNITPKYYWYLMTAFVAPIVVMLMFIFVLPGGTDWMGQ